MNQLPNNVLLKIFSYINWHKRIIFESVSKRWESILLNNKTLRYVGSVNLNALVRMNSNHLIPGAIQSLVKKGKIIDEIIADSNDIADFIQPVMQTITSVEPIRLTRLSIKLDGLFSVFTSCNPMISLCINLEVLELTCDQVVPTDDEEAWCPGVTVDLSGLMNLEQLTGRWIHFRNCRSQVLRVLKYNRVYLISSVEDNIDFVRMISSASRTIEVLHFSEIALSGGPLEPTVTCTLPKLEVINIVSADVSGQSGLTINLAESVHLRELHYWETNWRIIYFDLSVSCLTACGTIVEQFVNAAKAHPGRLCLLEKLHIAFPTTQLLIDFSSCISNSYTYSLRELTVKEIDRWSPDSDALVILVKRSPYLVSLDLRSCSIDMQCLIDIITVKVNVEAFSRFNFRGISNMGNLEFLYYLNNCLSCIDPPIMKRQNKMSIGWYSHMNKNREMNRSKCEFEQKFNIVIN